MVDRLFVVIGAGASRGCAPPSVPRSDAFLPPLVPDLFSPTRSGTSEVLSRYPLAKLAAADLRDRDDSLAIEEVIRTRYRDSPKPLDQRIFRAIAPYLQELLHRVSYQYTPFPQNYESLVTNLLRLDEVVFVSLNYDLVLDNVLVAVDPLVPSLSWYISPQRPWSLIKLHGSVNWARNSGVNDARLFLDPPEDLMLGDDIVIRPGPELWQMRGHTSPSGGFAHGALHYPVLSVPVGQADELAAPPNHVEFLQEKLASSQPLHLLLIGYSGNDREVLALIRESDRGIKTLTIVDHNKEGAEAVAGRLTSQHGLVAESGTAFEGDFNHWVESGALAQFVDDMSSRPF